MATTPCCCGEFNFYQVNLNPAAMLHGIMVKPALS